jgi:Ice-binding-like/PEP-CTERM motif
MRLRTFFVLVLVFVLPLLAVSAYADTAGILTAGQFAVLGASTVTNTGPTTLSGSLGLSPGTSITGFFGTTANEGPGLINAGTGTVQQTNPVAAQALLDAASAFGIAASALPVIDLTGDTLGVGLANNLSPGNYKFTSSASTNSAGTLILNAGGNNNASWVFQIGSTLVTGSASSVEVVGLLSAPFTGAITWEVGSSATFGTTTAWLGTTIAQISDTLNTGATIGCGRVIALTGAVTLDTNVINTPDSSGNCAVTGGTGGGTGGTITPPTSLVPEPGTFALLSSGLALGFLKRRKLR